MVLDGEVGNSTYAGLFADKHPDRYFEMYIAEQQLVAAAVGLQARGWVPFTSTFAAFFSRAFDFIRMAAVSRADIRLVGSHCGVSIGEDGPSQRALEDIAALRAVQGSTVLYPSCANQTAKLIASMAERSGIVYLRTTRAATPVLYGPEESFTIGGSRVVRSSADDVITIVAAGITLHETLAAADELAQEGVSVRVIDLYSVKPIDEGALAEAAEATGAILAVEDHHPEGGIGDAVLEVFADGPPRPRIVTLAVREMPTGGAARTGRHRPRAHLPGGERDDRGSAVKRGAQSPLTAIAGRGSATSVHCTSTATRTALPSYDLSDLHAGLKFRCPTS